eukprot:UC4_evm1s769
MADNPTASRGDDSGCGGTRGNSGGGSSEGGGNSKDENSGSSAALFFDHKRGIGDDVDYSTNVLADPIAGDASPLPVIATASSSSSFTQQAVAQHDTISSQVTDPSTVNMESQSEMAAKAQYLFEAGKYSACIEIMKGLQRKRGSYSESPHSSEPLDGNHTIRISDEHKISMNFAIARHCAAIKVDIEDLDNILLKDLLKIWNNVSTTDSSSKLHDNSSKDSEHTKLFESSSSDTELADVEADIVVGGILAYNIALLRFRRGHHFEALSILEPFFKLADALDEALAQKICFLLLDIYLALKMREPAGIILEYLDKLIVVPAPLGVAAAVTTTSYVDGEKQRQKGHDSGGRKDVQVSQALNVGMISQEKERLLFLIHQYKARMYIQARSLKSCKREIKSIFTSNIQSSQALFLKSNFEYLRRNYRKSIKLLNGCRTEVPTMLSDDEKQPVQKPPDASDTAIAYFNNLGCVHFHMKKYGLANLFLGKALSENENRVVKGEIKAAYSKRQDLMFNKGIILLHSSQPMLAHKCLAVALETQYDNPFLWLHLGECCISEHSQRKNMLEQPASSPLGRATGCSVCRKLVISDSAARSTTSAVIQTMTTLSLDLAQSYFKNILVLLDSSRSRTTVKNNHVDFPVSGKAIKGRLGETHLRDGDEAYLRGSAYIAHAYIALENGDWTQALEWSNKLLKKNANFVDHFRYFGYLYAADALLRMHRITDALEHLSPENISKLNLNAVSTEGETVSGFHQRWDSDSGTLDRGVADVTAVDTSAKALFYMNLASAFSVKREFDKAERCLSEAVAMSPSTAGSMRVCYETKIIVLVIGIDELDFIGLSNLIRDMMMYLYINVQHATMKIIGVSEMKGKPIVRIAGVDRVPCDDDDHHSSPPSGAVQEGVVSI